MSDQIDLSLAARFTQGVGLVDISPTQVKQRLGIRHQFKNRGDWRLHLETSHYREAIEFLSTLAFPATRHVIFATRRGGAAFVNNNRNGSDCGDYAYVLPRILQCRFARVVCHPARFWKKGSIREILQYEARMFQLYGPDNQEIRAVLCFNDGGRWAFNTFGNPHPIEATFPYDAKRKPDRFSDKDLRDLADAYGFSVPGAVDFINAGRYVLYHEDCRWAVSCTLEEADDPAYGYYMRGMGWVAHMKTHYASVIADFERCVAFNPAYQPRVQAYLDEARRRQSEGRDLNSGSTP